MSFLTMVSTPEELIAIFNRTIDETYNPDVNVLFAKGDALVTLEMFDEAIPVFEEILKYPYDKEVLEKTHNVLGVCYSRKNDLSKAINEFEKAREYSNDPIILYNLATNYLLTNEKEKALELFKEISDFNPSNKNIKTIIEKLELELERDLINEYSFNSVNETFIKADNYMVQNEFKKANSIYNLITEALPEQPPAWNKKGLAYYQLGKYVEAMECFDNVLEFNPNSAYSQFYKSMIYMQLEDFENAENMIVEALMIIPNNTEFLNNYCVILIKLGREKEAIDIANKALIIEPDSFETYTNKAYALENLNRFEEAIECYEDALNINPNFFEAWYNKAYALENLNRFDETIECYKKAFKLTPNNYHILGNIYGIYMKKGYFDNAEKYFLKAIELHNRIEGN